MLHYTQYKQELKLKFLEFVVPLWTSASSLFCLRQLSRLRRKSQSTVSLLLTLPLGLKNCQLKSELKCYGLQLMRQFRGSVRKKDGIYFCGVTVLYSTPPPLSSTHGHFYASGFWFKTITGCQVPNLFKFLEIIFLAQNAFI